MLGFAAAACILRLVSQVRILAYIGTSAYKVPDEFCCLLLVPRHKHNQSCHQYSASRFGPGFLCLWLDQVEQANFHLAVYLLCIPVKDSLKS